MEQVGEESGGRAIMMTEYQIDGATCWAGYSLRSGTVYISMAACMNLQSTFAIRSFHFRRVAERYSLSYRNPRRSMR